jgi:hypothetical protein
MSVLTLIVYRYVYYKRSHKWKQSVEKTHVCNLWFVGKSIGNKYTDGFTNIKVCQNKFTCIILFVSPSVTVAFRVILFHLSLKYTNGVLSVTLSIIFKNIVFKKIY